MYFSREPILLRTAFYYLLVLSLPMDWNLIPPSRAVFRGDGKGACPDLSISRRANSKGKKHNIPRTN
jgi:hypothetical protein